MKLICHRFKRKEGAGGTLCELKKYLAEGDLENTQDTIYKLCNYVSQIFLWKNTKVVWSVLGHSFVWVAVIHRVAVKKELALVAIFLTSLKANNG